MSPEDLTDEQRSWLLKKFGGSMAEKAKPQKQDAESSPRPAAMASDTVSVAAGDANNATLSPTEPEPELYVRGRRITERDVRVALRMLGDDVLAAYANGQLSKHEAYAIAQRRVRELMNLGAIGIGSAWAMQGRSQRWRSDGGLSARGWSQRFRRGG